MNIEVLKCLYDGQKFNDLGSYKSLEIAHSLHDYFKFQQTFEDIDQMNRGIPYLHLMEIRDGEHYNDLYFTAKEI